MEVSGLMRAAPLPSRLYAILDTRTLELRGVSLDWAAELLLGEGVRFLQLRHKLQFSREWFDAAERLADRCRDAGATLIVNDRADLAKLLSAGCHVGQDDLPPEEARRFLGTEAILGMSTHSIDQAKDAARRPVNYVAIGPVFGTASKQNPSPAIGLDGVRGARAAIEAPLVAIGGITRETAGAILGAGADSLAVIADLYPDPCTADSLRARVREWLSAATGTGTPAQTSA